LAKGKKQKELEMWWQADVPEALSGTMLIFARILGRELAEAKRFIVKVRKYIKESACACFYADVSLVTDSTLEDSLLTCQRHVVYRRRRKKPQATKNPT
jgi:hypothetical protein